MHIRRVRVSDSPMRRFVEELWLPYQQELGTVVESHSLADEVEVDAVVDHHCDVFDSPDNRLWIALDDVSDPTAALGSIDATFAGFLSAVLEPSPPPFDGPDRLLIGDFYVKKSYRGDELADTLVERAVQTARENGCSEVALDVDVDNDRALAYYEKLGFDVGRHRMRVSVDDVGV